MSKKRVIIGRSEWTLPDGDVEDVVKQITSALEQGTTATLRLIDPPTGHTVSVYLNGRAAESVAVDLGEQGRPSEISG